MALMTLKEVEIAIETGGRGLAIAYLRRSRVRADLIGLEQDDLIAELVAALWAQRLRFDSHRGSFSGFAWRVFCTRINEIMRKSHYRAGICTIVVVDGNDLEGLSDSSDEPGRDDSPADGRVFERARMVLSNREYEIVEEVFLRGTFLKDYAPRHGIAACTASQRLQRAIAMLREDRTFRKHYAESFSHEQGCD